MEFSITMVKSTFVKIRMKQKSDDNPPTRMVLDAGECAGQGLAGVGPGGGSSGLRVGLSVPRR